MSEESNDVTKALAAFGAPSIRYHSFGQAQIRPSSITLPRRPVDAALPMAPAAELGAPVIQEEPIAAPETPVSLAVPPPASVAPRPSPLFPSAPLPTVAPPPRPLAEWAAPVTVTPTRPVVAAPLPPMQSFSASESTYTAVTPPAMPVTLPPRPAPAMVAVPPPAHYTPAPMPSAVSAPKSGTLNSVSSLPEIFEYLAAS